MWLGWRTERAIREDMYKAKGGQKDCRGPGQILDSVLRATGSPGEILTGSHRQIQDLEGQLIHPRGGRIRKK